jgi:hypothetical protein
MAPEEGRSERGGLGQKGKVFLAAGYNLDGWVVVLGVILAGTFFPLQGWWLSRRKRTQDSRSDK